MLEQHEESRADFRTTSLIGPLLIGPRSALAQGTKVLQSTLGADCSLGPNTTVSQSYVFDDVQIGANCSLDNCMVGRNVSIADGVKVGRGVLIGDGVRIGKGVVIPDFARVGRQRWLPEYPDEEDEIEGEDEKGESSEFATSELTPQPVESKSWAPSLLDTSGHRRKRSPHQIPTTRAKTHTSTRATRSCFSWAGLFRTFPPLPTLSRHSQLHPRLRHPAPQQTSAMTSLSQISPPSLSTLSHLHSTPRLPRLLPVRSKKDTAWRTPVWSCER